MRSHVPQCVGYDIVQRNMHHVPILDGRLYRLPPKHGL